MFENLDREEKVRALIGSALAAVGALLLGYISLPDGSTLLLGAYFGAGILFGILAVALLFSLR